MQKIGIIQFLTRGMDISVGSMCCRNGGGPGRKREWGIITGPVVFQRIEASGGSEGSEYFT